MCHSTGCGLQGLLTISLFKPGQTYCVKKIMYFRRQLSRSSAQQGEAEGWTIRSTTDIFRKSQYFDSEVQNTLDCKKVVFFFFFFQNRFFKVRGVGVRFSREMNTYFSVLSSQSRSALSLISRPFVWPARSFLTFARIRALLQSKKYTEVINIVLKMAFKSLKFQGLFIVESALGLSSWFTGPALKYLETNNSNTT